MYMVADVRFFGVVGPRTSVVAGASFAYLQGLYLAGHRICALPVGAAVVSIDPSSPQLGHWAPLADLFAAEPPPTGSYNIVCSTVGWRAGSRIARPLVGPFDTPLPAAQVSAEPAYVPQTVFATYWTEGFRNIAIVCKVDPQHPDELAALSKYPIVIGLTPEVREDLHGRGVSVVRTEFDAALLGRMLEHLWPEPKSTTPTS